MSSFIGAFNASSSIRKELSLMVQNPDILINNDRFFVLGKGASDRFFFAKKPRSFWIAAGIGINADQNPDILSNHDWNQVFTKGKDSFEKLNGHYATCWTESQKICLATDQIGMRNIFFASLGNQHIFSSRLDWLLKIIPKKSLNWNSFGGSWLLNNPFSGESFITGIQRINQGGYAEISENGIKISNKPWDFELNKPSSTARIENYLKALCTIPEKKFGSVSLGLSGGMDSRLLYSLLLTEKETKWDSYTFTEKGHPDTKVSEILCKESESDHFKIPSLNYSVEGLINSLSEFSTRTLLSAPITNLIGMNGYKYLGENGKYTIDGAFGEIGRRRFLRSIQLKQPKLIGDKNAAELLPYFYAPKADIFIPEIHNRMYTGALCDLKHSLDLMPDIKKVGMANWLDLFTIRTRVPFNAGATQEYSDEFVFHYMPFIQPSFLNMIFNLNENERKNAHFFRTIIKKNTPYLTKIDLVKGSERYPFWMKDLTALGWIKIKNKFSKKSTDLNPEVELLLKMKEFISDSFSSDFLSSHANYDTAKVSTLLDLFYNKKNYHLSSQIGWMICFESFRKQIE